jgi:hypothetical protein
MENAQHCDSYIDVFQNNIFLFSRLDIEEHASYVSY